MKIEQKLKVKAIVYLKENKERILKNLSGNSFDCRFIEIPVQIDGVIDKLVYDTVSKKFTKFVFTVGDGRGISLFEENSEAAFYEKTKLVEIPIDQSFN